MDVTVENTKHLDGVVSAPSSKAYTHRMLIAASLSNGTSKIFNPLVSEDTKATLEAIKALGAKESNIWGQFLLEAIFLTCIGGVIGVAVGWTASKLVSRFADMTTLVSADTVILAVSVSICIGVFFGFYPAWSASRLNPIEALRHE